MRDACLAHILCLMHSAEGLSWARFQAACMTGKVQDPQTTWRVGGRGGLLFACLDSCGTAQ